MPESREMQRILVGRFLDSHGDYVLRHLEYPTIHNTAACLINRLFNATGDVAKSKVKKCNVANCILKHIVNCNILQNIYLLQITKHIICNYI